jgi:uncharacterized repeat protein (TIGR01451 family)
MNRLIALRRAMIGLALLTSVPLAACGAANGARLQVTQTSDATAGTDHKGHMAPGTFAGITVAIRNVGAVTARGLTIQDLLPDGFRYYELTTLGGNAIRTSTQEPGAQGNPQWGTWTIPAASSSKESELVLSFKVQAATQPGDYTNHVKITGSEVGDVDEGDGLSLVVEPRPSLTVTTAATTDKATTGGTVTYVLSVNNVGSAVAKGVVVSATLPPGFSYTTTTGFEGNSQRITNVDPPGSSLLPVWASWNIPPMIKGAPGLLRITFQARILPGVQPGIYTLTTGLTAAQDIPAVTAGNGAPVAVGKGTTIPISVTVAPTSPYAAQGGTVTYVITVENDSNDAATGVKVTDTLPAGFTFAGTNSITIGGKSVGSRLQPSAGTTTPQWGPFTIPAGGFNGVTLVITLTAKVNGASLGPHPNVVSGSATNAQITGAADQSPVTVTSG